MLFTVFAVYNLLSCGSRQGEINHRNSIIMWKHCYLTRRCDFMFVA